MAVRENVPLMILFMLILIAGSAWLEYQWKKKITKDAMREVIRETRSK